MPGALRREIEFFIEHRELLCQAVVRMPVVIVKLLKATVFVHSYGCDIIWIDQISAIIAVVYFSPIHTPSLLFGPQNPSAPSDNWMQKVPLRLDQCSLALKNPKPI